MVEPVEKSAPTLIDIPKDSLSGELVEDELRIISGMLVSCLTSFVSSVPGNFDHEQEMVLNLNEASIPSKQVNSKATRCA